MAMQEPTFFILTALVRVPLHGYGIIQAVEQLSDGRVRLKAGTLYAALDRLTSEGLIAVDREEAVGGRLRRYYVLSDDGRAALETAVERLQSNARVAASRLREAFGFIGGVQHV
ncbi:MAG TPA: PadR family transcriptional regulator [Actinoplanes sp.]|nr:PadR family transcriptional regulator [Actinoplanes sp.]